MAFQDKKNRLSTPFIPNSKLVFTLPMGDKIQRGKVILTGLVTITGATPGTQIGEGGPANLIKRIIVTATPRQGGRYAGGKIVDCTPRSLLRYAITQHNGKFVSDLFGSTLNAGAAGANLSVYTSIPIYWSDSTLRNQVLTALDADPTQFSSVQVEVDTGDLTTCFSGNTNVATWAGLNVQWVDDRVDLPGSTNVLFQEDHTFLIPATMARAFDQAMPQDGAFTQWLLMQEQSAQLTLSNALLQRVQVDGTPISFDKYTQDIQQEMLDEEWVDPAQSFTGLAFIDWTDSVLGNSILANTLQTRFQVTNVSGANLDDLLIYTRRVFAPAPSK